MERRKRFNVFANLSNVSAVPSVTLGTTETSERLCETLKRFSRSKGNAWSGFKRCDAFCTLEQRFGRSKRDAWNGRNVSPFGRKGESFLQFQEMLGMATTIECVTKF